MYFWRIEKLKEQLVQKPLSDRESLPYLVWFVGFYAVVLSIPNLNSDMNFWDHLSSLTFVLTEVLGTIFVFLKNGGANGRNFLQRYLSFYFVVSIRLISFFILACLILAGLVRFVTMYYSITYPNIFEGETTWHFFVFSMVVSLIFYWRMGHHINDVAEHSVTFQPTI